MAKAFAKRIYNSKAWKDCREAYYQSQHGICERCGAPGDEVHHKRSLTPVNINDPEIVYGWSNLELLCRACHIEAHEKKKNLRRPIRECEVRYMFDANGNLIPRGAVKIVWGSPASGKTTYVRQHMRHMDIMIDLDEILRCFTGLSNKADDPSAIKDYLPFAIAVRDAFYRIVGNKEHGICAAWIIAGLPTRKERSELQQRFDAEMIHMDCSCEEALRRAEQDSNRTNKQHMARIITEYFRNFEA